MTAYEIYIVTRTLPYPLPHTHKNTNSHKYTSLSFKVFAYKELSPVLSHCSCYVQYYTKYCKKITALNLKRFMTLFCSLKKEAKKKGNLSPKYH